MLMFQPLIKYADFSGRARRAEYWQFVAFTFGVGFVLGLLRSASPGMIGMLTLLFQLGVFLPSLAVSVRRLHDTNRTGWWVMLPTAVMVASTMVYIVIAGANVAQQLQSASGGMNGSPADSLYAFGRTLVPMLLMILLPTAAAAVVTFIFHILPGTEGSNRFGGDPKGGAGLDVARVFDAPDFDPEPRADVPHKPVFDFGPARGVPAVREVTPTPRPTSPGSQAWSTQPSAQGAPRPTFGKRR